MKLSNFSFAHLNLRNQNFKFRDSCDKQVWGRRLESYSIYSGAVTQLELFLRLDPEQYLTVVTRSPTKTIPPHNGPLKDQWFKSDIEFSEII